MLRAGHFAQGESDEGLDVAAPIIVEGVLVIRHPARGQSPAVGFLAYSAWRSWEVAIGHARAAQW